MFFLGRVTRLAGPHAEHIATRLQPRPFILDYISKSSSAGNSFAFRLRHGFRLKHHSSRPPSPRARGKAAKPTPRQIPSQSPPPSPTPTMEVRIDPKLAFSIAIARPILIWGTIGANIYVFYLWSRSSSDEKARMWMMENFTLSQQNLREGRYWTIVTSAFSHATIDHLAFNMFAFHFVATLAFYSCLGTARILTLALGSIATSCAGGMLDEMTRGGSSHDPRARPVMHNHLGASGMIQGFMAAMALTQPFVPVRLMFIPVEFAFWKAAAGFVLWDLYNLAAARKSAPKKDSGNVVGYSAHLGGAAFGVAYYFLRLRTGF